MALPYIELILDKVYKLRWDFEEMIAFEKQSGKNVATIDNTIETLLEKLSAMLKSDIPDITPEKAKQLIKQYRGKKSIDEVMGTIVEAIINGQLSESPNVETPAAENITND